MNFNTKGILGRRKCITKKEGLGAGRGGCFPPSLHPRPPGALGSRDETLRVPPSPQEPGEFKQGAPPLPPPCNPLPATNSGGWQALSAPTTPELPGGGDSSCPSRGSHTCSLPPSFPSGCASTWAYVCFSAPRLSTFPSTSPSLPGFFVESQRGCPPPRPAGLCPRLGPGFPWQNVGGPGVRA